MDDKTRAELENAARAAAHEVKQAGEIAAPKLQAGAHWAHLWIAGHPQFAMGFAAGAVIGAMLTYLLVR